MSSQLLLNVAAPTSWRPIAVSTEPPTRAAAVAQTSTSATIAGTRRRPRLIQNRRSVVKAGIPFLNKIPVIGYLFGTTTEQVTKTELILLITPRVIGDPSEGQEILQQVRGQRPGLERDLRNHPNILRPETEPAKP